MVLFETVVPICILVLGYGSMFIVCYFEKRKEVKELFRIRFSESREMERRFKELQLISEQHLDTTEARHKSVKIMRLLYGDWWFALPVCVSEIQDQREAECIRKEIEWYLCEQHQKSIDDLSHFLKIQ